jgi:hypothetical protein
LSVMIVEEGRISGVLRCFGHPYCASVLVPSLPYLTVPAIPLAMAYVVTTWWRTERAMLCLKARESRNPREGYCRKRVLPLRRVCALCTVCATALLLYFCCAARLLRLCAL